MKNAISLANFSSTTSGLVVSMALLVAVPSLVEAQGAAAGPNASADFDLRLGVGYSDNVNRAAMNPLSSRFDFVGFRSNYFRDGNRLDVSLSSDIMVRDYSEESIPSQPIGSLNAGLDYAIVPNRVFWQVNDYLGQGTSNQFAPSTPDNRQQINVISTGPRVSLPLGARTNFIGSVTKSKNDFGGTVRLDYDRTNYDIQLDRALSPTATLGLGANAREIEFDDGQGNSDRTSVYLSYSQQLATGSFSVRGGSTKAEFAGIENDSPFMDATWARRIGARSNLTLGLVRNYADAADIFIRNTIFLNDSLRPEDVIFTRNLVEFTRARADFSIAYPRTTWSFGTTLGELRNEGDSSLDNDEISLFFGVSRVLRPRLQISLFYRLYEREYLERFIDNRDRDARLSMTQRFGRRYFLTGALFRASRDGRSATFPYEESTIQLSLGIDLNP